MRKPVLVCIALAALVALGCAGSPQDHGGVTDDPAPSTTAAHSSKPGTASKGTLKVGTDIKVGSYVTDGADGGCYWARLKSFDGDLDAIITSGLLDDNAKGRFTVKATDKGVELTGDCVWKRES